MFRTKISNLNLTSKNRSFVSFKEEDCISRNTSEFKGQQISPATPLPLSACLSHFRADGPRSLSAKQPPEQKGLFLRNLFLALFSQRSLFMPQKSVRLMIRAAVRALFHAGGVSLGPLLRDLCRKTFPSHFPRDYWPSE